MGEFFGPDFFLLSCRYELVIFPAEFIFTIFLLVSFTVPRVFYQMVIGSVLAGTIALKESPPI